MDDNVEFLLKSSVINGKNLSRVHVRLIFTGNITFFCNAVQRFYINICVQFHKLNRIESRINDLANSFSLLYLSVKYSKPIHDANVSRYLE